MFFVGKALNLWEKFSKKDLELDFCLLRYIMAKLILNPSGKKGGPFTAVKKIRRFFWEKFSKKDLELDFCLLRYIMAKLILNPSGKKGGPFTAVKKIRRF